MAVAISQTANPAGPGQSSTTITYDDLAIGVADESRFVVIAVGAELSSGSPSSATIDGVAMSAGTLGSQGAVFSRIFYLHWPTGTTADIAITFGATQGDTTHKIAAYRVVAGKFSAESAVGDTDADPITSGAITIPTGGGCIGICANAATTARTWTGITEDIDEAVGTTVFRFSTGTSTTGGTPTITVSGGNNEDGALSWLIFAPGRNFAASAGSFAFSGTDATVGKTDYAVAGAAGSFAFSIADEPTADIGFNAASGSFAFSGDDATLTVAQGAAAVSADSGSFAFSGTDASLEQGYKVGAESGSFAFSGTDASLEQGYKVGADAGSFAFAGQDASLEQGYVVGAEAGAFAFSGDDATLALAGAISVVADSGVFVFTGTDVTLTHGVVVVPPVEEAEPDVLGGSPGRTRFTRRQAREFWDSWRGQEAVKEAAKKAKRRKRRALEQAAKAAAEALNAIDEEDIAAAKVAALTRELEAAEGATKVAEAIEHAKRVVEIANAILRQIEDDEDEEAMFVMSIA